MYQECINSFAITLLWPVLPCPSGVANYQLDEHFSARRATVCNDLESTCNHEVVGSIPTPGSTVASASKPVVEVRVEIIITEAGRGSVQRRIGQVRSTGFDEDGCVEPGDLFGEDEELSEVEVARH